MRQNRIPRVVFLSSVGAELRHGAGFVDGLARIEAQRISDDEERAALRAAGMSEVAVEGISGMSVGKRHGFTPEQPRSVLTTTPSSLAGRAITHLRPVL